MSPGAKFEAVIPPETLEGLLEKGRQAGSLSADEVVEAIDRVELLPAVIETLVERLKAENIELDDDFEVPSALEPATTRAETQPGGTSSISLTDPVRAYMQTISAIPVLRADEERQLAELVAAGQRAAEELQELSRRVNPPPQADLAPLQQAVRNGMVARTRLVEANLRLVVSVAKKYRHRGVAFLDLIQEGNAGLMRAVEKFDHTCGFKLSTYATWWIRQAMSRAVAESARTIRIPVHVYEALSRVLKVQRTMLQEGGHEPSIEELAHRVKMPADRVRDILSVDRSTVSLEPVGDEPGLHDVLPDSKSADPADVADRRALSDALRDVLVELNERERELMRLRFGLEDGRSRSLEEVGQVFGVTRERVRQIESKTLAKLRTPLERQQVEEFLRD